MFALFLIALSLATLAVVTGVLADGGLRWWSAFGMLRRELKGDSIPHLPSLRPVTGLGGYSAFDRCGAVGTITSKVRRAA